MTTKSSIESKIPFKNKKDHITIKYNFGKATENYTPPSPSYFRLILDKLFSEKYRIV